MKSKKIVSVTLALMMAASGAAFAEGPHDRGPGAGPSHDRGPGGPGPGNHGQYANRGDRNPHEGRGAGPDHRFYRGDRLPMEYRNRQYVVNDWRGHHLNAPPRGYHWVQVGGDYVLVAVATGIIAQLILGN